MSLSKYTTPLIVYAAVFDQATAKDDGLALTPPMGWMAWEYFRCNVNCTANPTTCVNEANYLKQAQALAKYKHLGYDTFHVDDCYMAKERNAQGEAVADPERFPHGMKWFGEQIHALGLKYGMYSDTGAKTCGGYPGVNGEWTKYAEKMKAWNVDYLKLDGCNAYKSYEDDYTGMSEALTASGQNVTFSCSWPAYMRSRNRQLLKKETYPKLQKICHLWRNYFDIQPTTRSIAITADYWATYGDILADAAGPGHWNDPDTLLIGRHVDSNKGTSPTFAQMKIQFALWAMIAAPMILGNNMLDISAEQEALLMNKEIIAVSQNKYGRQGKNRQMPNAVPSGVWFRVLDDSDELEPVEFAWMIYNTAHLDWLNNPDGTQSPKPATQKYNWLRSDLGFSGTNATCTELFTGETRTWQEGDDYVTGTVSDVLMYRCKTTPL